MTDPTPTQNQPTTEGSIKETLISLLISFVMALTFRSYIVEAFIIPTGSMAPTLLGSHIRFTSEQTGHTWPVNPWYYLNEDTPFSIQGPIPNPGGGTPIAGRWGLPTATDPSTASVLNPFAGNSRPPAIRGYVTPPQAMPLRAGDRILVHKYLYQLFPPERYDVVVFKNPELSTQNFIKRLVGLPNEQLWIAAGDIFARPVTRDAAGKASFGKWSIQRKPHRVQSSLWRRIYSSEYLPLDPVSNAQRWFYTPWNGSNWQTQDRRDYRCDTAEPSTLAWDHVKWPITSWEPYNEFPLRVNMGRPLELFPVPDLRLRAHAKPDQTGLTISATIETQGHEFQASLAAGKATIRMRPTIPASDLPLPWTELVSAPARDLRPGRFTSIEFLHADQQLELRVGGSLVASATYDWSPSQRLEHATAIPADEIQSMNAYDARLAEARSYSQRAPRVAWSFSGSPLTLTRVELDRDVYYEAVTFSNSKPGFGTHPATLATLGPDQFMMLGDNSASSKDGRLWDTIDPWVADQIDPTMGVVPRDLILGKAFFVYFPSTDSAFGRIPVPDFGRLRFIK